MQNVEEINKNIENKTVDKQAWQSLGFDELQTIEILSLIHISEPTRP